MELNLKNLEEIVVSLPQVSVPGFDVSTMQAEGQRYPRWIYIGPGNLFRCFPARIAADLLERGENWPIIAVAPRDLEDMEFQLPYHDLLTMKVTLNPGGTQDYHVIAGITEAIGVGTTADTERLSRVVRNPGVELISYAVTERGYGILDDSGELQAGALTAMEDSDPKTLEHCRASTMMPSAMLLLERFAAGGTPITMLSFDNFSHNGDKLRDLVLTIARAWIETSSAPAGFLDWLEDEAKVAFPITVIDEITPRPSPEIATKLANLGSTDLNVRTPRRTPLTGFVNTEPTEYPTIGDKFTGSRPAWEDLGVQVVAREACDDFENTKVTTCLSPLHTALTVSGCLTNFPTIDAEIRDPALVALVHELGWKEGLPVMANPGVAKPEDFLREVLKRHFPNRYLPDNPACIAMDASRKIPIRFGVTIRKYLETGRDLGTLRAMSLVSAPWCRCLLGVRDDGSPFELASDPCLTELSVHVAGISLSGGCNSTAVHEALALILSDASIFGLDLYGTPLTEATEQYFQRLIVRLGAVHETLDREYTK